jgi:hypothetical protein
VVVGVLQSARRAQRVGTRSEGDIPHRPRYRTSFCTNSRLYYLSLSHPLFLAFSHPLTAQIVTMVGTTLVPGYSGVDFFNTLSMDPYTEPITDFAAFASRVQYIRLVIRRLLLPPINTDIVALQHCVHVVSFRPPRAQARFVYELNARGRDNYQRTWNAERPFRRASSVDTLPLYSPPPPPYESPPPPYEPPTQTTPSPQSAQTIPRGPLMGSPPSAARPSLARAPMPSHPSRINQHYARLRRRRPSSSLASRRANLLVGSSAEMPIELDSSEDDSPPPRRPSTYSITHARGSNRYNPMPRRAESLWDSINLGSSSTTTNPHTRPDLGGGDGSAAHPYDLGSSSDDDE